MTVHYLSPMDAPAYGVSGFPVETAEHLAMIALHHAGRDSDIAIDRLGQAIDVLRFWQRAAMLSPAAER